jgi:anti-anti-sigma regulatory factor
MCAARVSTVGVRSDQHPAFAATRDWTCELSAVNVGSRVSWLRAAGAVDAAAAGRLGSMLEQQCAAGYRFARLDLSEVSLLVPAALNVLVDAHYRFLGAGGTLVLTGVGPHVAPLLELVGLDQTLFTIARATDPPPAQTRGGPVSDDATTGDLADQSLPATAARAVIDQAVGIVMGRGRCNFVEGTERLRVLSRATNRTLREVAQSILNEATRTRSLTHRAKRSRSGGQSAAGPLRNVDRSAVMAPRPESGSCGGID